ncbi:MAG: GNAT family N-acetyltransferase [Dokdonella sp.]
MSAVSTLAPRLAQALHSFGDSLTLRSEVVADFAFIAELYAEVRNDVLAPVPWPEQAKRDFLSAQCRLQRDHYAKHYVGAEFLVVERMTERSSDPIGRIYAHAARAEIRLMDIALLSESRGRGIGTVLVRALQDVATQRGVDLTLHVEPENPAQRLYQRLGFTLIENRGVYDFLGWSPCAATIESQGPIS